MRFLLPDFWRQVDYNSLIWLIRLIKLELDLVRLQPSAKFTFWNTSTYTFLSNVYIVSICVIIISFLVLLVRCIWAKRNLFVNVTSIKTLHKLWFSDCSIINAIELKSEQLKVFKNFSMFILVFFILIIGSIWQVVNVWLRVFKFLLEVFKLSSFLFFEVFSDAYIDTRHFVINKSRVYEETWVERSTVFKLSHDCSWLLLNNLFPHLWIRRLIYSF